MRTITLALSLALGSVSSGARADAVPPPVMVLALDAIETGPCAKDGKDAPCPAAASAAAAVALEELRARVAREPPWCGYGDRPRKVERTLRLVWTAGASEVVPDVGGTPDNPFADCMPWLIPQARDALTRAFKGDGDAALTVRWTVRASLEPKFDLGREKSPPLK